MTRHSHRMLPLVGTLALLATTIALRAEEAAKMQYITDLSRCTPASALSKSPREGHWQLIAYETLNDPNLGAGTMVGAASFVEAPELTLPLDVSGWHAVYVGYWNPFHADDGGTTIKVRLSDDPCFIRVSEPEPGFPPCDPPGACPERSGKLKEKTAALSRHDLSGWCLG